MLKIFISIIVSLVAATSITSIEGAVLRNSFGKTKISNKVMSLSSHKAGGVAAPCTCDCCTPGQLATGNPVDKTKECVMGSICDSQTGSSLCALAPTDIILGNAVIPNAYGQKLVDVSRFCVYECQRSGEFPDKDTCE